MKEKGVDQFFLSIILGLLGVGFAVFLSASVGLLARDGIGVSRVIVNQAIFGIGFGLLLMWAMSNIDYRKWKVFAFYAYIASFVASFLVFVPFLGFEHGGAHRWLDLGFITVQPAEFLKLASVLFAAAWLSSVKAKIEDWRKGLLPVVIFLGITALPFLLQPDLDNFIVVFVTVVALFFMTGAPWKHMGAVAGLALIGVLVIVLWKPYVLDRFRTFIDPSRDSQGASWQIQQSLIAIGSGGAFGRGLGQSVQKFNYLPEPIGDSIFAVAGEEFGFVGGVAIILLFLALFVRGLFLARRAPDAFGGLVLSGVVIMIVFQSFFNMGAMMGILPLSGLALIFVSKGGTAMLAALAGTGIALSVTRHKQSHL